MKKTILSILAIASVILTGCEKKEVAIMDGSRIVKVSATLETTKVSGTDQGKFSWEAGDVIGVWTGTEFTPFTVDAASVGTGVGTFTGTLPEGGAINDASYAVYPYNAGDSMEGSEYTSKYNDNNWELKHYIPLAAKPTATASGSTTVASYKFGLLTALAKLSLKNIPAEATSIFIETPAKILLGEAKADLSAEYPKFTQTSSFDYAFVSLPEHTGAIESLTLYIPLVTGEKNDPQFRFTLFSTPAGAEFQWNQEMPKNPYNHVGNIITGGYINRGDLYILPEVTF